jgi:hypothetical protein
VFTVSNPLRKRLRTRDMLSRAYTFDDCVAARTALTTSVFDVRDANELGRSDPLVVRDQSVWRPKCIDCHVAIPYASCALGACFEPFELPAVWRRNIVLSSAYNYGQKQKERVDCFIPRSCIPFRIMPAPCYLAADFFGRSRVASGGAWRPSFCASRRSSFCVNLMVFARTIAH